MSDDPADTLYSQMVTADEDDDFDDPADTLYSQMVTADEDDDFDNPAHPRYWEPTCAICDNPFTGTGWICAACLAEPDSETEGDQ